MTQEPTAADNSKRGQELKRHRALAGWAAFRDPRVWGAYLAQILGFVLLFLVVFPTAQPRFVLVAAYAVLTMALVRRVHSKAQQKILDARNTNSEPA
jgi:hypothetical protein